MRRLCWGAALTALALPAAPLLASGDYGCEVRWSLFNRDYACANSAALAPGNDSRVNLFHLLRDRQGATSAGVTHARRDWEERLYGRAFFDWALLRQTFYPRPPADEAASGPDHSGTRCISLTSGSAGFAEAMRANARLPARERDALLKGRDTLAVRCGSTDAANVAAWPGVSSRPGLEFLAYLRAADAFYAGHWDAARRGFAGLRGARDPWLAETAVYMMPRVALNAAQAGSFTEYGDLDRTKAADDDRLKDARRGFESYIKRYPEGRYAGSAQGLVRRTMWLAGDAQGLSREYERLLAATPVASESAAELVQEIDNKLLIPREGIGTIDGPLLLATIDLMMMRGGGDGERPQITAAQIAAQEPRFAGQADLFGFVQANHAFYVAGDMTRVLQLLPDDARRTSFSSLQFSRQVLRGLALGALKDRNEAGFWRDMLPGADRLYQRPLIELALAMTLERSDRLAEVFAPGSPIEDGSIREILMTRVAGPDILRAQAKDASRSAHERDVALFTLLYQQLRRGAYAGFGRDLALVRKGAETGGGVVNLQQQDKVPVGLFRAGTWSDGYACPALSATAAALARNPANSKARLCLGDFYRINGFDGYGERHDEAGSAPHPPQLGDTASLFPGKDMPRGALYAAIAAERKAPAADKAYALFRAIHCYSPNGNNTCGGEAVEPSQRQAWFRRLKGEFGTSPWAKQAKYYW